MSDREQRVRDVAYFLWLEAGCPEGEAESHWLAAEDMVDSEPKEEESRIEASVREPKKPFSSRLGSD